MLLGLETAGFRAALDEYLSYYLRLYAAIREVSGCDVIVDSSKITSLAYVLSHVDELRLAMIHMIRDARAVAYSWTKVVKRPEITSNDAYMPRYSPAYMAMLYNGHHVLLELLRLRGVPSVRIRYEDFAEDPEMSLSDVAILLGRTFDRKALFASQPGDPPKLQLPASHTVSGNPSRFTSGDVAVRRDEAWRQKMPARQRVMVGAITAPVQAAYGYLNAERKAALRPDGSDTRSSAR
jgi:hypothetical protein